MNEEAIFAALAARMDLVTWTRADASVHEFQVKSRRVKMFSDAAVQPACYQAEPADTENQITGMPYKTVLEAFWIIYHDVSRDMNAIGTTENNLIIQACRVALAPLPADVGFQDKRNTLGSLVHHCFIQGRIFKEPGDLDGQAMLTVPIKLLVP